MDQACFLLLFMDTPSIAPPPGTEFIVKEDGVTYFVMEDGITKFITEQML